MSENGQLSALQPESFILNYQEAPNASGVGHGPLQSESTRTLTTPNLGRKSLPKNPRPLVVACTGLTHSSISCFCYNIKEILFTLSIS